MTLTSLGPLGGQIRISKEHIHTQAQALVQLIGRIWPNQFSPANGTSVGSIQSVNIVEPCMEGISQEYTLQQRFSPRLARIHGITKDDQYGAMIFIDE